MHALRRLILCCRLCDPDGVLIEPSCGQAVTAAVDHALDEHPERLDEDWDSTLAFMSVAA